MRLTFNIHLPQKNSKIAHVAVLNCPYFGD